MGRGVWGDPRTGGGGGRQGVIHTVPANPEVCWRFNR